MGWHLGYKQQLRVGGGIFTVACYGSTDKHDETPQTPQTPHSYAALIVAWLPISMHSAAHVWADSWGGASPMASDVYPNMMSTVLQGRGGGGGNNSSTANLVRLLREAEEGKGLEIDYADALDEVLRQKDEFGEDIPRAMTRQQKGARKSLTSRGRVSSLGRKRWGNAEIFEAHQQLC